MSKHGSILMLGLVVWLAACGSPANTSNTATTNASDISKSAGGKSEATPTATPPTAAAACYEVDTGKKTMVRSQTFAIDFEPFKDSCFVTSHDPKTKGDAEIAIYKGGKKVFDFPDQFGGLTVGCRVEAVAFQDVNGDQLTDVVVVAVCLGKVEEINENMVYLNNGKTLVIADDENFRLSEFKSIKEILDYIKQNPKALSPRHASPSNSQS